MKKQVFPLREKLKAVGIHFIISLFIFILLVFWMYFSLYPSFYFNMSGGWQGLMLMLGVDVVLGPLLTFLVFNPHKKLREIISDLVIVGFVQLGALGYGVYTVYQEHPTLAVLYDNGLATVLPYREVAEYKQLQEIDLAHVSALEKVPLIAYQIVDNKKQFNSINNVTQDLTTIDKLTRQSIRDADDLSALKHLEQQHGQVWVFAMMGKYTGAYIVVDKDLNYLGKIGEKPVS